MATSDAPMVYSVTECDTEPYSDQKPGTSGLRKPTATFLKGNYTENFIQSILSAALGDNLTSSDNQVRLLLGGDGRYFVKEALKMVIIPMCAANGVTEVLVGQNGILSTPAASCVIRKYRLQGGILLTASHNPGGLDADFGIKYNCQNGGPAPEKLTNAIFEKSKHLHKYCTIKETMPIDLCHVGAQHFSLSNGSKFTVSVISSVTDYADYMSTLFDFNAIQAMLSGSDARQPFTLRVSGLHGVMGPYITEVLCNRLGMPNASALKAIPLEDFGGGHPDPNLTYAADLVQLITDDHTICMAAAFDGDGDRNMLLGERGFFISPGDSLAVIADNVDLIKYFRDSGGARGFARSMPTSRALDRVCQAKHYPCFETPTGWKFFGNLMDAGLCSICGEESFGTGSSHIREKDGLWALLAWLSILAHRRKAGQSTAVESVMREHWLKYGRHFFTRYDYENFPTSQGQDIMSHLKKLLERDIKGQVFDTVTGQQFTGESCDDFSYQDPVDASITTNQGIRLFFTDGSRFVYRLSGTGSSGATLRVYIDTYEQDTSKHALPTQVYLKAHIDLAVRLCGVVEFTGRLAPTVIT